MKKIVSKFLKINAVKFGIAGGIIFSICVIFTTIAGMFGLFQEWAFLIQSIYSSFGYSLSWLGVLLGGIYSFVDGFILTWIFAVIYNKLL